MTELTRLQDAIYNADPEIIARDLKLLHKADAVAAALHQTAKAVARVERHTGALKDMAIIVWLGEQPPVGTLLYAGSEPRGVGAAVGELHVPEKGVAFPFWQDHAINKLEVGDYTLVVHAKEARGNGE